MSYHRPCEAIQVNQVIKKSQFIGNIFIVNSSAQAIESVNQIKSQHSSANHSCHCFIAGLPEQFSMWGYSDDGEPKGTAGLPMFNVLKHSGLGNICVVVTRYFGGIKLGTGGIARAYSSTVNLAINNCLTQEVQLSTDYSLISPFNRTGEIEHAIKHNSGVRVKHRQWLDSGLQLTLAIDDIAFNSFLISISGYQHELIIVKIDSDNK